MKNCAFTIVAKNYIGLAQILEMSIRRYYNDLDFYIIVADEVDNDLCVELPSNVLIARNILNLSEDIWEDMSFKYDLTEFCTSIKPSSFLYLMKKKEYEKIIYLDPDICFYSSINQIYEILDDKFIVLTPHIVHQEVIFSGDYSESGIMNTGIFNLGFLGVKDTLEVRTFLNWWNQRLLTMCFNDLSEGLYTDQKWLDLIPCFFTEGLCISKNLGMNLAPWNFHERMVYTKDNQYWVKGRKGELGIYPLIFVHYSGFNYVKLKVGDIEQRNVKNTKRYDDIDLLMFEYSQMLKQTYEVFEHFIKQNYSYNYYSNGVEVTRFHRNLYKGLVKNGRVYRQPFKVDGNSLYNLLLAQKVVVSNGLLNEKKTRDNIEDLEKKLKFFNRVTRLLYNLLGVNKYLILLRLLAVFSRYDVQVHLLDKRYDTCNINK